ncbi:septum formation family protein [Arthrobacter sp. NPDC097144]|uniref:septum formation family protein n=1 Tax=Arthrobacter sp. NPDC097144 TaxID=3363946 RepID=UPI003808453E
MSDKNSTPENSPSPAHGASDPTADTAPEPSPEAAETAAVLPDLEAHAEPPQWLTGDQGHDGQLWSAAFDSQAENPAGSQAEPGRTAGEPELTDVDDVTLAEPALQSADISADAAEASSLADAADEVKAVEAEAADAAVLTDPAANHPAARAAGQSGAAQASRPENADADPVAPENPAAAPAPESRRAQRNADQPPGTGGNGNGSGNGSSDGGNAKRILIILGILGILAVLVVLLFTVVLQSEKAPGVVEENVEPLDLKAGDCLQGFEAFDQPVTVVTCETPHNAQLVATDSYPDDDSFPGSEALSAKATEVCAQVQYSETMTANPDLQLQETKVVPTEDSWDDGDRRVDCFVVSSGDQDLTASLLQE